MFGQQGGVCIGFTTPSASITFLPWPLDSHHRCRLCTGDFGCCCCTGDSDGRFDGRFDGGFDGTFDGRFDGRFDRRFDGSFDG